MQGPARRISAVGLYLAGVQFCFALGWIVYVAYLPRLAEQAGLPAGWVPWLLLADQAVFVVTDLAVGIASDRAAWVLGRIGRQVVAATLLSTAAFVLLPWVAPQASPPLFAGLTLIWAVTSSALRAPPLTLLGRYVAKPSQPMLLALSALGLGIANAGAPYLAMHLKGLDPRWPFALSALALAAVTLGMVAAERALAASGGNQMSGSTRLARAPGQAGPTLIFLLACLLGAAAFQWHQSVSSSGLALRHAGAGQLPMLLPVFWIGFNLCLVPAGFVGGRLGGPATMALGAELAMVAVAGAAFAPTLPLWLAAQLAAGAGWALLLCAAFGMALDLGHVGREGLLSGALCSVLALAALARIAIVAGAAVTPAQAAGLAWWPALGFALCATLLVVGAVRH